MRLPNDLEDLKGYTSLSLFLQRPESTESGGTENMFVMYLGNKDVSIALTFLLFLKQNMVFEMRDTTVSLPLTQQEEMPSPLMAPQGDLPSITDCPWLGDREAWPDGPGMWAHMYVHVSTSTSGVEDQHPSPYSQGCSTKASWRSE